MKKLIFIFSLFLIFPFNLYPQLYFQKLSDGPLVNTANHSNESAWGDYDNDGDQDVVISSLDDGCACPVPLVLFNNNGDNSFTRVIGNGISDLSIVGSGIAWGDYDNDEWLDLFVCGTINSTNKLLHNNQDGTFSLVTTGIVVNDILVWSQGCAWGDYNRDGWLDLFVANRFTKNFLYKNNGDGTFAKITEGSIVNDIGSARACAWGDYDNDGWPDLFVVNYEAINDFLYHNNGDGSFTRITAGPMVNEHLWGSCCAWIDYDNNGWLDLHVTGDQNKLYKNTNGTFALDNNLLSAGNSYGLSWGDYDNDGLTDAFTCNVTALNTLFRNTGPSGFVKASKEITNREGGNSITGCMVDYNNNGKLDLFVTNRFNYLFNNMYVNFGATKKFLEIKLLGCINKFGVGARIKVVAGGIRQIKEVTSGSGWGSQNGFISHFGVGNVQSIDSVIVFWPSGKMTRLNYIQPNQTLLIQECETRSGSKAPQTDGSFVLHQNVPNPFNPATLIYYNLPDAGFVTLKVYDILGNEVATLVKEDQNAGSHSVQFNFNDLNSGSLSSGTYFYRLTSGNFTQTKRMMILK